MQAVEGHALSQGPRQVGAAGAGARKPHAESAAHTLRRLLNDREAAQTLGVGERTFAELIASADWLPQPINLGPRLRRWDADELLCAARTKAPRGAKNDQPAQLRRAQIERMKAGGAPAAA